MGGQWLQFESEMRDKLDAACMKLATDYDMQVEGVVREKLAKVISAAILSGDLRHCIVVPLPPQNRTHVHADYIPFRGIVELRAENAELKKEVARLCEELEAVQGPRIIP